ncbi:hypothetical protein K435DRAFT_800802 [Dendrothele bispora CBS 962.96]|uniref:Uncharacterized protein n=1 Tax=Dendrothele bispora (strain CBS 962.96) TaxID=1314807 RepID=A0A4S8LRD0_DENBC|nr:hypothetical protein K435DRAFT_800802 [Dendrothele bispora CBS 962.96]
MSCHFQLVIYHTPDTFSRSRKIKWLAAFSIIYNSKPSLVLFIDDIHRTFPWHTPTGKYEKGKGNGKGETYEERYRTQLQIQVFRIQMRSARHMSRSSSSARYCIYPQNQGECKEGEYEKESKVHDPFERSSQKFFEYHWALDYSIETDDLLFYSSYFVYNNHKVLMLMKESLEIKGKTLDKDLCRERPLAPATKNEQDKNLPAGFSK